MDNAGYTVLNRQIGLRQELQMVANNIANMSTSGFRKEGLIFSEYVHAMEGRDPSLSMARATARTTDFGQGVLSQTGGQFDLAIEGGGFFLIETPQGNQLTRAGSYTPNAAGELVNPDGYRLLDNGQAPVFVPPDAQSIAVASDGTFSADGRALGQIGLFEPVDPNELLRQNGVMFQAESGVQPGENGKILQGFIEGSNVNAVVEITRLIEVQRAYETSQKLLDQEHERIRSVMQALGR